MPLTDPAHASRTAAYWAQTSSGFSDKLAAAVDYALDSIDATDAEAAAAVLALHGFGKVPTSGGFDLAIGTGLSVQVANGDVWILGRKYTIADVDGFDTVTVPADATTYLYVDDDLVFYAIAAKYDAASQPTDYVYLGSCITGATTVLSVSMTDADELDSMTGVATDIAAIDALIVTLRAAVGEAYMGGTPPATSLDARVTVLEGLPSTAGGIVYASALSWSATDPRLLGVVIQDLIDASVLTHEAAYHADDQGDGGTIDLLADYYDWGVIQHGLHVLFASEYMGGGADLLGALDGCFGIVWHVYGDGSDSTPNNVHASSTWTA